MEKKITILISLCGLMSQLYAFAFIGPKWPGTNPVVEYYINERGCEEVPDEWEHLQNSFSVWQVPSTAIKCNYMGTTNVNTIAADRKNVLVWASGSDWPLSGNVIAACYYWYNNTTLIDFDIVFNGRNFKWSTTGEPDKMDVGHIATHEVGHALGLDHSSVSGAVMWPTASTGDISHRALSADDSIAISLLYPRTTVNNHAPVITSKPVVEAIAGLKYEYQVSATDADGDSIIYSLATKPFNMKIDSITGKIVWYPKFLDLGPHSVVVTARDKFNGIGKQAFTVNVSDLVVFTNDTVVNPGEAVSYNVMVTPMDDYGILAGNIEMVFNHNEFSVSGIDTVGSILHNVTLATNLSGDTIRVAFAAPDYFSGSGVLFRLNFSANGAQCGKNSGFKILKAFFNDGNPVANTKNGVIYIACNGDGPGMGSSIDGKVVYSGSSRGVSGVKVECKETATASLSSLDGTYRLAPLPRTSLPYTIRVRKDSGDVRQAVSAYDASLILRYVVGLEKLETFEYQKKAADVNANNMLTAYDAALVLRYIVGLDDVTKIGNWVCAPSIQTIPKLDAPLAGIDFKAYMIGDVSGNWGDTYDGLPKRNSSVTALVLNEFIQSESGTSSGTQPSFKSTISIVNPRNDIYSGELDIDLEGFDAGDLALRPLALLNGFIYASNFSNGKLKVAFAGTSPLISAGDLFELSVTSKDLQTMPSLETAAISYNRLNEISERVVNSPVSSRIVPVTAKFSIGRVYPNPFITSIRIEYNVASSQPIELSVFDLSGRKLITLANGIRKAGRYEVAWDGRDNYGRQTSAKVFLVRYVSGSEVKTVRLFKAR